MKEKHRRTITAYLFLLPSLAVFIVFWIYPLMNTFRLSFFKYNMISDAQFIGFDNWRTLFNDPLIGSSLMATFKYVLFVVPVLVVIPLFMAVLLSLNLKFSNFFKGLYYLPTVISVVILCLVWGMVYNSNGMLNAIMMNLGPFSTQVGWLTNPNIAIFSVGFVTIVGNAGFYMIIYLTGLTNINKEIREASLVDGASNPDYYLRIAIPMVRPQIILVSVIATIGALKVFPEVFLMTGGGPLGSTNVIVYYIYELAFSYFQMGYASSVSVLFLIMTLIVSVINIKILDR